MGRTRTRDLLDELKIPYQVEKYYVERYIIVLNGKMMILTVTNDHEILPFMSNRMEDMRFSTFELFREWLRGEVNGKL